MYNHAPSEYVCPYCLFVQGKENDQISLAQTDIVFQTRLNSVHRNKEVGSTIKVMCLSSLMSILKTSLICL